MMNIRGEVTEGHHMDIADILFGGSTPPYSL
jgi:hypothetical protein